MVVAADGAAVAPGGSVGTGTTVTAVPKRAVIPSAHTHSAHARYVRRCGLSSLRAVLESSTRATWRSTQRRPVTGARTVGHHARSVRAPMAVGCPRCSHFFGGGEVMSGLSSAWRILTRCAALRGGKHCGPRASSCVSARMPASSARAAVRSARVGSSMVTLRRSLTPRGAPPARARRLAMPRHSICRTRSRVTPVRRPSPMRVAPAPRCVASMEHE